MGDVVMNVFLYYLIFINESEALFVNSDSIKTLNTDWRNERNPGSSRVHVESCIKQN